MPEIQHKDITPSGIIALRPVAGGSSFPVLAPQ